MEENLNWEHRKKLGINKIIDQVNDVTKQVVSRELKEISKKMDMLNRMGLIKDCKPLDELKKKIKELNLEVK